MALKITVIPSNHLGESRELIFPKQEIRIGRGLYNDVVLDSLDVSPNHAILTLGEIDNRRTITVTDLGSSSGTRLEGAPVPSRYAVQMSPSQRLEIGGFTLKLELVDKTKDQDSKELKSFNMPELRSVAVSSNTPTKSVDSPSTQTPQAKSTDQATSEVDNPPWLRVSELNSFMRESGDEERKVFVTSDRFSRNNWMTALVTDASSPTTDNTETQLPAHEIIEEVEMPITSSTEKLSDEISFEQSRTVEQTTSLTSAAEPSNSTTIKGESITETENLTPSSKTTPQGSVLEPGENESAQVLSNDDVSKHSEVDIESKPESVPVIDSNSKNDLEKCSVTPPLQEEKKDESLSSSQVSSEESVFELGDVEVTIIDSYVLLGTVLAGESGVSGVEIDGGELGTTYTSQDGTFSFGELQEGRVFSLKFTKHSYRFFPETVHGKADDDTLINIVAQPLRDFEGVVTHKGVGVGGVEVSAGTLGKTTTNAEGIFRFQSLPTGSKIKLSFVTQGFRLEPSLWEGFVAEGSLAAKCEINATKLTTLTGRILHKGRPVVGAEIDGGCYGRATTGVDGRYSLHNIPEGTNLVLEPIAGTRNFRATSK